MYYLWLFLEVIAPSVPDEDSGNPVLSWEHLALIEGKTGEIAAKTYNGIKFITAYQCCTGHKFILKRHDIAKGLARTVCDDGLPTSLREAWELELSAPPVDPVDFITGRALNRRQKGKLQKADRSRAEDRDSKYLETQEVIRYLNDLPIQPYSKAIKQHGLAAITKALAAENPRKRLQDLITLRYMYSQPKQFYGPSRRDRSRRLHPRHRGVATLSREVRAELCRDWLEADLARSQLTSAGYCWQVPELIAFLESEHCIWEALARFLGINLSMKPWIKKALYSLTYGAKRHTIIQQLRPAADLSHVPAETLGARLLNHPAIAALYAARESRLKAITEAGGAYDCYGYWIKMTTLKDESGDEPGNARSVLAIQAQAIEFKILSPIFALARETHDFYITHWAHDGFCLDIQDKRRTGAIIRRIEKAVTDEALALGVPSKLEWKGAP